MALVLDECKTTYQRSAKDHFSHSSLDLQSARGEAYDSNALSGPLTPRCFHSAVGRGVTWGSATGLCAYVSRLMQVFSVFRYQGSSGRVSWQPCADPLYSWQPRASAVHQASGSTNGPRAANKHGREDEDETSGRKTIIATRKTTATSPQPGLSMAPSIVPGTRTLTVNQIKHAADLLFSL